MNGRTELARLATLAGLTLIAGFLFYWFGIRAAYNFWAAGGPPTQDPAAFALRGRWFSSIAAICLVLCGFCFYLTIRSVRRLLS
jgi:hypothetical protein